MRVHFAAVLCLAAALDNGAGRTPGLGWSTWNTFGGAVSDALLRESAQAMVSSGLRDAGYSFLNLDDGWCVGRNASGYMVEDPKLFPNGMKSVVDYVHSLGLKFGIYSARGSLTCLGRPGSDGHEVQDAQLWASWGVDYLKEDSCGGHTTGTMWEQYARMRDALNATGRPIYFSITQAQDFPDGHPRMHCYGDGAFSTLFWVQATPPLDPRTLANSYLIEYCNGMDFWGYTDGYPKPGGFLSNLDSQQLLTWDNMTAPGSWNDMDMLEVCHGSQTYPEYAAQFSTWSILASPLILGNDIRTMTPECLAIVANKEVIAVNQDPLGLRGKLVLQWPQATWPPVDPPAPAAAPGALGAAPLTQGVLALAPCNASDATQAFTWSASDGLLRSAAPAPLCVTYGGYAEANTYLGACTGWSVPGIGSQQWAPNATRKALVVVGNTEKVLDVYNCDLKGASAVQVCTAGGADCAAAPPAAGCGVTGQQWAFDFPPGAGSSTSAVATAVAAPGVGAYTQCLAARPLPPPPVDIRLQVWAKPLVDGSVAFVAFNRATEPLLANVTWAMLGWGAGQAATLRDLWAHADVPGQVSGLFSVQVQPHAAVMYKATLV